MVLQTLGIPVLDWEIPQSAVIDPTDPTTRTGDQHPIRSTLVILRLKTQLTQPPKGLVGLQNAEATACRFGHLQIIQNLLQNHHLGLAPVGIKTEPAEHHQPKPGCVAVEHQHHHAVEQRRHRQGPAGCRGHLNTLLTAAGQPPDHGLEDQTAIQR